MVVQVRQERQARPGYPGNLSHGGGGQNDQGGWTTPTGEGVVTRNVSWTNLWATALKNQYATEVRVWYPPQSIPVNLEKWKAADSGQFSQCGKRGILEHILSSCAASLSLSGVPDYFYRNKISSGGDLSHYSSASLY